MRFRFLAPHSVATDGLTSSLRSARSGQSLARHSLRAIALGTALSAGCVLAGPLWAAPTVGGDELGPKVQILAPGYQDVLNGKTQILLAIQANKFNPQSIEMFVDDKPATNGPIPLAAFPSSSFDWDTRLFSDGPHKLTVRVTDTQGFRGWAEVNVYIKNSRTTENLTPPSLEWKNADSLQTLSGTAKIELKAVESFGVKWVILSINPASNPDQKPALRSWLLNRAPFAVEFESTDVPDGQYVLSAKAYDALDQQGDAPELTLNVVNNALSATTLKPVTKTGEVKEPAATQQPAKPVETPAVELPEIPDLVEMPPVGGGKPAQPAAEAETPALSEPQKAAEPVDDGPLGMQTQALGSKGTHTLRPTVPTQAEKPVLEANTAGVEGAQAPAEDVPASMSASTGNANSRATGAIATEAVAEESKGMRFAARPSAPEFGSRSVTADADSQPAAEVLTEATLSAPRATSRLTSAVSKAAEIPAEDIAPEATTPELMVTLPSGAQSESRLVLDAPSLSARTAPESSTAEALEVKTVEAENTARSENVLRVSSPSLSERAVPAVRVAAAPKTIETDAPAFSANVSKPALAGSRATVRVTTPETATQTRVAPPSLTERTAPAEPTRVARHQVAPSVETAPAMSAPTAPKMAAAQPIQVAPKVEKSAPSTRVALNNKILQRWESGPRAGAARVSQAVRPASAIAKAGIKSVASGVKSRVGNLKAAAPETRIAALPRTNTTQALDASQAITVTPLEVSSHKALPVVHRVERTTTLRAVAARYGLPVELVAACNEWPVEMKVVRGMEVKLPRPLQVSYKGVPVAGDSPSMLMGQTGVTAFRFLFEQAGGKLEWDSVNQRVLATKGNQEIELTVGSKVAKVNDREVMMELAAFLFEGRTMVPVRFFEQGLHAKVDWDPQTGRLVVAMANDAAIR